MATKLSNWTMRAGRTADFDNLSGYVMRLADGSMTWFDGMTFESGARHYARTRKNVEWMRGFVVENGRRVVLA